MLEFKIAIRISIVVKQLLYLLKLFRVTAGCIQPRPQGFSLKKYVGREKGKALWTRLGCIHSFRIRSKETLRIMYPKYPVLDMIQRIHLRC